MDDNDLRTVSESPQNAIDLLESAWQKSMLFDQLAGIKVNTNKTVCFGNTPQTRSLLVGNFSSLRLVNSFVLVVALSPFMDVQTLPKGMPESRKLSLVSNVQGMRL